MSKNTKCDSRPGPQGVEGNSAELDNFTLRVCKEGDVRVQEIVTVVSNKFDCPRDHVIAVLLDLEEEGLIYKTKSFQGLLAYSLSPEAVWFWSLCATVLAVLATILIPYSTTVYLRYLFGGVMVLYLPGWSIVQFLFDGKGAINDVTRLALSIALSLAIVSIFGLALNYTTFGIRTVPVITSLSVFVLAVGLLTLKKKYSKHVLGNLVKM